MAEIPPTRKVRRRVPMNSSVKLSSDRYNVRKKPNPSKVQSALSFMIFQFLGHFICILQVQSVGDKMASMFLFWLKTIELTPSINFCLNLFNVRVQHVQVIRFYLAQAAFARREQIEGLAPVAAPLDKTEEEPLGRPGEPIFFTLPHQGLLHKLTL